MILKVLDDNGYKIELVRPIKDIPIQVGTKVDLKTLPEKADLKTLFDNLLDDDTKDAILDKFNEAKKDVPVS